MSITTTSSSTIPASSGHSSSQHNNHHSDHRRENLVQTRAIKSDSKLLVPVQADDTTSWNTSWEQLQAKQRQRRLKLMEGMTCLCLATMAIVLVVKFLTNTLPPQDPIPVLTAMPPSVAPTKGPQDAVNFHWWHE